MELREFFENNPKVALAFSGGVDSAYLLYAAKTYGADVAAYYMRTPFQPAFEWEDARRLAEELKVRLKVIERDLLTEEMIKKNPKNRCYYCKKAMFSAMIEEAEKDGYFLLADGTNADDDETQRPGMKALAELGIRSPLKECGIGKAQIRRLSKEAGLFTHQKPAYACLATRIPCGQEITPELLKRTERSEAFLAALGFRDFRVRLLGDAAKLQITEADMGLFVQKREEILKELSKEYRAVLLDLQCR